MFNWLFSLGRSLRRSISKRIKNDDPPFMVAQRDKPKSQDGERVDIKLVCPMCQTHWADATVYLGGHLSQDAFQVKEPFKSRVKIKSGEGIFCPSCGYQYTGWAINATILAAMNRRDLQSKIDTPLGATYGKRDEQPDTGPGIREDEAEFSVDNEGEDSSHKRKTSI